MSYSKMLLEQYREESKRESRPGYQNILEDVKSLVEDMPLSKAASEYPYMLSTKQPSRRGLIPAAPWRGGENTPSGTYYPMSPGSLAAQGASGAIRKIADPETKLSDIVGPSELETLQPSERESAAQALGKAQTELSTLRKMPDLTPGDFQEIGMRSAEASKDSAKKLEDEIRSISTDPEVRSGSKSLSGVTRALNPLEGQRQKYEDSLRRVRQASTDQSISDDDYYKIEDEHLNLARRLGTSAGGALRRSEDVSGVLGDVGSAAALGQIYNDPNVARQDMVRLTSKRFGNRIRAGAERSNQAARDALINQAGLNPNDATRITRTAADQDFQSLKDITTDVANRRREHNLGMPAAARALGKAGVLPGVGRSGYGRGK